MAKKSRGKDPGGEIQRLIDQRNKLAKSLGIKAVTLQQPSALMSKLSVLRSDPQKRELVAKFENVHWQILRRRKAIKHVSPYRKSPAGPKLMKKPFGKRRTHRHF